MDYKPQLPAGFDAFTVDAAHPRYLTALAAAKESGLSQAQFSEMLGMEARKSGVTAPGARASYDKLSFAEKIAASDALAKANRR
jgi:hypothetical protein